MNTALTDEQQLELYQYSEPTYENFIAFVERYCAPHMDMEFVTEEYYRTLWDDQWQHKDIDAQISRGHSKSEIFAILSTIYFAVIQPYNPFYEREWGKKKRIVEQLVFSSDTTTVGELSDRINDYFEEDDVLRAFKPNRADGDKWNHFKFELTNGSIIHFRGMKMKRGLHVDRAVGDDLTTESSTLTDNQTKDFFNGAFLPMTTVKVAMTMIDGTPIRQGDVMTTLEADEHWHHIKLPCSRVAIEEATEDDLLSPNRFTVRMLQEKKRQIGSVKFGAEYMLNPIDDTTALIKREWVQGCYDETVPLYYTRAHFDEVYLGVDFAFSDRVTADHSVFCSIGVADGKFYLLNYIRRQGMSGPEQLELIRTLHEEYKYDMIGLEENSIKAVTKEFQASGMPIKMFHTGNIDERDKKKPNMTGTVSVSKTNFVHRLGATFENNNIVLPYKKGEARPMMDLLMEECISWALDEGKLIEVGRHPDIPIALGYALEVASQTTFAFGFA